MKDSNRWPTNFALFSSLEKFNEMHFLGYTWTFEDLTKIKISFLFFSIYLSRSGFYPKDKDTKT